MSEQHLAFGSESQGKITINQDLASALLRDNANEGNVMSAVPGQETEKVYVDWPETDDDEEYRFVSSRVDDYKANNDQKAPPQGSAQGRTYILKDNTLPLPQSVAPPAVVDPKNSPLHVRILSGNTYQDERTLQDEADYQRQLQQRIENNSLKDAQLEIPRLDLEALRESAQDFVADSLDVISVRSPNPPREDNPPYKAQNFERDSLDVDNEKVVDSLEFNPQLNSTFNRDANGYQELTAIDSSRDPPPRETIVRPPPYGKEETQRNNSNTEMDKYNRAKFQAQHYDYGVKDDNRRPAPQGQGHYDQDRDRWEAVDNGKEDAYSQDQKRASPVPYAGRVEYEARIPVRNDEYDRAGPPPERYETQEDDRRQPQPVPDYRYENYERDHPYREPPRQQQYGEDPRGPPMQAPHQYREPAPQRQQPQYEDDPRGGPPRHAPQQRQYDYIDRRQPPSQDQNRQDSRPLPEKRAHFQNDNYNQQVAYEQAQRQGQFSQRPPTPYQEEIDPGHSEQYKGPPPPQPRGAYPQGSAHTDLGIYNDESESEPSAVNLRMQNELERDLEELYQNRKGKPRRQLQNDEVYSQTLQERTGGNTDRGESDQPVKKSPQKSPSKPAPDFVEDNKQTYGRGPKRTYGKILEKRKDDTSPKRERGPKNISNSAGALSDHEERIEVEKPVKPSSAEDIWAQRAKRLQQKTSGKGPKKSSKANERGPMRKYPSESSVPSSSKKHMAHLQPLDASEPHVMAPYQAGTTVEARPVQAVWSDDGQRVSLDINLKLVSPSPNNKPPLPPVGHSSDSASNVGSATQVDRIYDYPYADPYSLDQMTPRDHVDHYLNTSGHYNAQVNPYRALPPIPQDQNEDSYVAQYRHSKQAAHVGAQYKPYSLNDYKKMQKEVKLGGLGPDLDNETRKEKQEKKMRQQEYARQIHMKNVQEYQVARRRVPPPPPKEEPNPFTPNLSKRSVALEYSNRVQRGTAKPSPSPQQTTPKPSKKGQLPPKPPTRFAPTQGGVNNTLYTPPQTTRPFTQMPQGTPPLPGMTPAVNRRNAGNIKANQPELIDLTKLLQQHQRDKENVTAIRQNLGGGPSLESKV
ncbi:serine/arginine repetitive matrix protein 1-like [Lineus longissimus]|uniref:serine/arginine repetitive matrix protein 1-like n=1 Tax=Lineus longissimus TaxID=88925 RepID=UPI002B4EB3D9